jgi:hypothetical protein
MVVANRNGTLQKCQDCNHRETLTQPEPEAAARSA